MNEKIIKLIKDGLYEQLRVLSLYMVEDYPSELDGNILTHECYTKLKDVVLECFKQIDDEKIKVEGVSKIRALG